jgi:hypothetical protein
MKRNILNKQNFIWSGMIMIGILLFACNKSLIVNPDACFTTNRPDSLGEYVESDEFQVGEPVYFVSCGIAQFEVVYTGVRNIKAELQKQDGSESILFNFNSYFPDKTSQDLGNYFNKDGTPLTITGLPLALAGEYREASYKYSEEGDYEVYLEAINRDEEGTKTRATSVKVITILPKN